MTRYKILDRDGESWVEGPEIEARSGASALRAYLEGADIKGGKFVAIPLRSFRPVTVKVETKTALKFS